MLKINFINLKVGFRFCSILSKTETLTASSEQFIIDETQHLSDNIGVSFFEKFKSVTFEKLSKDKLSCILKGVLNPYYNVNDLMVMDNINSIKSAIKMNAIMKTLLFAKRDLLQKIPFTDLSSDVEIFNTLQKNLQDVSHRETETDIMAIFKRQTSESQKKVPLTLILDNITEPQNLINIITTAAGYNIHRILLTSGCVSMYNSKIVNETMEALLHIPIYHSLSWSTIRQCLSEKCLVFYGDTSNNVHNSAKCLPYFDLGGLIDVANNRSYGLVIGGENHGVSEEARSLSASTGGARLVIPIIQNINSFNSGVAAAILMSEFQRIFVVDK